MTTDEREERAKKLNELEEKRELIETQWININKKQKPLSVKDKHRLNDLRDRLDELNNQIICAIVLE